MTESLRALLAGVVDYAGLFPPAQLPFAEAFTHYLSYRTEPDAWMLGRFVVPASRLAELTPFARALQESTRPVGFAILGRGGRELSDWLDGLDADLRELAAFRAKFGEQVEADELEVKLPAEVLPSRGLRVLLLQALDRLERAGGPPLGLFCEAPEAARDEARLTETLDALRSVGEMHTRASDSRCAGLGFKLRCGGLTADAFPSAEQVASVLRGCQLAELPLKLTAGLHHPLPRVDPLMGGRMHGFLNLLVADLMLRIEMLPPETVIELLTETEAAAFTFTDRTVRWRQLTAIADPGQEMRRGQIVAFGSCSFDEPRDDLRALGWL